VSLFVWLLPFDLSGLGGPTGSYATAGIALQVLVACRLPHNVKVETPLGETAYPTKEKKIDYLQRGISNPKCLTCNKIYVGQTGRIMKLRYHAHVQYIGNSNPQSA